MSLIRCIGLMRGWGNGPLQALVKGVRFWMGHEVYLDRSQSAFR